MQPCCAWLCALLTRTLTVNLPPCLALDLPHCYWMVVGLGPAQLTWLRYGGIAAPYGSGIGLLLPNASPSS